MSGESVSPHSFEQWMQPFDQDAEERKLNEDVEEEKVEEAVKPVVRDISQEPTEREIEEHYMHHSEFRQWCPHCVKGKAVSFGHRRRQKDQEGLPMISVDYMFMADKQLREEEKGMPMLVLKDRCSKALWARVVPAKGVNAYAVKELAKQITLLGYKKILFRSDGEPAIKSLKEAVKNELGIEVVMEESPVGDHAANGDVESAVRQVQGQIRTMKDALESRYGERLPGDSHAMPWLVAHAAATITRFRKDDHGLTAYRRWKGKEFRRPVAEFGECVWYLKSDSAGRDKYGSRWHEGVWLGIFNETGECIIGTDEGVVKAKDFRRKPIAKERWDKEKFQKIRGVPWKTSAHADGDELRIQINMPSDDGPLSELIEARPASEPTLKRYRIRKEDILKYGYTVGCLGCRCMSRGQPAQSHSEICRSRITAELRKEGDVRLDREKRRMEDEEEERGKKAKGCAEAPSMGGDPPPQAPMEEERSKRRGEELGGDHKRRGEELGRGQTRNQGGDGGSSSRQSGIKRSAEEPQEGEDVANRIRRKVDQEGMEVGAVHEELIDNAIREHYDMVARGVDTVVAYERQYYDNLSGEKLDPDLVKKARAEEMNEFAKYGVYEKVPLSECRMKTGAEPIGVRWVDVNKGDAKAPEYRSRLVAQELKRDKRQDLFAAMPPIEATRILFSTMMSTDEQEGIVMDFIDVRRTYLHAKAIRNVYVHLPDEDHEAGMCGKLLKAMYGTRDAAQCWEREYVGFMKKVGFTSGRSSPCIFFHPERGIRAVIHGDDFTLSGQRHELDWFRKVMAKDFTIKIKARIGPGEGGEQATRNLNRIVEYDGNTLTYEADQRHAEVVVKGMGLSVESKSVVTPGTNTPMQAGSLGLSDSQYRMLAARCNYLAQDRPDMQYAAKEACRKMSSPDEAAWGRMKRIARYLKGESRVGYMYRRQQCPNVVVVWSDTDFAGCKETRKSTNGGAIMLGEHCVKTWSSTQPKIALSSGEAEYGGIVKASSEGMGVQSMLRDLGYDFTLQVNTDSSAAVGVSNRHGLGKVRHLDVRELWVQEKVGNGDIRLVKVPGEENIADLLTKHLDRTHMDALMKKLSIQRLAGRHRLAPVLSE